MVSGPTSTAERSCRAAGSRTDRLPAPLATVAAVSVTWIDLAGAHNVRDLGGLRAGAAATRPNVLLRADALDGLTTEDDTEVVHRRGLAHVVDLRSGHERLERG